MTSAAGRSGGLEDRPIRHPDMFQRCDDVHAMGTMFHAYEIVKKHAMPWANYATSKIGGDEVLYFGRVELGNQVSKHTQKWPRI